MKTIRALSFLALAITPLIVCLPLAADTKISGGRVIEGPINYCEPAGASGTAYTCSMSPALGSYQIGACYAFKADVANTAAATINFNSLGAKTIKKPEGGITTDIVANDLQIGQHVRICYDGTNMQMQSRLGNAAAGGTNINAFVVSQQTGGSGGASGSGTTWGYGFWLPQAGAFGHLMIDVNSADPSNNYKFAIYNSAGTLVANTTAATLASTGWVSLAIAQGTVTMAAGKYFFGSSAVTANTATLVLEVGAVNTLANAQISASSIPGSITPPADSYIVATSSSGGPVFAMVP